MKIIEKIFATLLLCAFFFGIAESSCPKVTASQNIIEVEVQEETIIGKPHVLDDIRAEFMNYKFQKGLSLYETVLKKEELNDYISYLRVMQNYCNNNIAEKVIESEIQKTYSLWKQYSLGELEEKYEQFPVATTAWIYLKYELGYNDVVCAAILGNMMAETGGNTFELRWDVYSASGSGCYGLLQWHPAYFDLKQNANLHEQLAYMGPSIQYIMNKEGPSRNNINFSKFISLQNIREATYAFFRVYENPRNNTYEQRVQNAWSAYYYFGDTR